MQKNKYLLQLLVFYLFSLSACHTIDDDVQIVLDEAPSEQRSELSAFISHFADNKRRQDVAKFIVANLKNKFSVAETNSIFYQEYIDSVEASKMTAANLKGRSYKDNISVLLDRHRLTRSRDLYVVSADSLISQLESVIRIWEQSPWSSLYLEETFEKYIAPYRIADEPLEYYWCMDANMRYKSCLEEYKDSSIVAACTYIYRNIDYWTNNLFWGEPLQSYSTNIRYKRGTCADHAVYTAMIMRALGIPTAVDFIPFWGDNNNGHSFNALLLPDGTCRGYNNSEDLSTELTLSGKVPKVYRKEFEIQRNTALYKYRDIEYLPSLFANHDLKDVTRYYNIPMTDVSFSPDLYQPQSRIVYLAVFTPGAWQPVAWAEYKGGKVKFRDVGIGYTSCASPSTKGEGYGAGGLFLPVCYQDEEMQSLTFPFILREEGAVYFLRPDVKEKETVVLYRKFPRKKRIIGFAEKMKGGYFELSNRADFTDSEIVFFVDTIPQSHMQTISLPEGKKYRYMRYYKRRGGISIGEMGGMDMHNGVIHGKVMADIALQGDAELKNIQDGDVLSYYDIEGLNDLWVGIDFGQSVAISKLFFCPRTDDNDVSPGDEYELLCWDKGWLSLGTQVAEEYSIVFKDVPRNALLWLRNLTKGREERPFTYENGKQIWW